MNKNDLKLGLVVTGAMIGSAGLLLVLIYGGITVAKWAWSS